MRFISVSARAFGALLNKRLELAPGLNIIGGLNGAGKSSWHAAVYAGLCGMRRGGGLRKEDAEFGRRYRPWASAEWDVTAEVELDNGRRLEIHHDLNGNVDCRAYDLGINRDVSADLINDGSPDGAKLVGLDRRTFINTACVRQAEILSVVDGATELQEYLQRAAASRDVDATAARAIEVIESFAREHVGLDRSNSTKPLRAARMRVETAEKHLAQTEKQHEEYIAQLEKCEELRAKAALCAYDVRVAEAVFHRSEAESLEAQYERAVDLGTKLQNASKRHIAEDEDLADAVASALDRYANLGDPPPTGEDPESLEQELAGLPVAVEGETVPDSAITQAFEGLSRSQAALDENAKQLKTLAFDEPLPASPRRHPATWAYALGIALAVGALALFFLRQPLGAAILAALFIVVAIAYSTRRRTVRPIDYSDSPDNRRRSLEDRRRELCAERDGYKSNLDAMLQARGYICTDDAVSLYRKYVEDCAARQTAAQGVARRKDVEQRLLAAQNQKATYEAYVERRTALREGIFALAKRCGSQANSPEAAVSSLSAWQTERRGRILAAQQTVSDQQELCDLLGARTLEQFQEFVSVKRAEADTLASDLDAEKVKAWSIAHGTPSSEAMRGLRQTAADAVSEADLADGTLEQMKQSLESAAEAREELANAQRSLDRVQQLGSTLDSAKVFLKQAQETVHRDIAPILVSSLEKWLPRITSGKYERAMVDPETLEVSVRSISGDWRNAMLLSHGTSEQIFLLVRIALVDHLTSASNETCPLLLDEVTAHSDSERAEATLNLLQEMSKERQIIAFSQEHDVIAWAERSLDGRDKLQILDAALLAL